jgi:6-phosphogluconolactonase
VYVANYFDNTVSEYTINPTTGAVTPIPGSPLAVSQPGFAAVDPSGAFVYVPNSADPSISGYTINAASGALTPIAGSPFPAEYNIVGIALSGQIY